MANVQGTFYSATTQRRGVTPVSPPNAEDNPVDPVEPSNPVSFTSLTDTPSTYASQSLKGVRVNSGETALEFYTIPTVDVLGTVLTGYTVGANTALAATDTILGAFRKVQGQINSRVSGTIASEQVAFGTGVNTIGGDSGLTWDNTAQRLSAGGFNVGSNKIEIGFNNTTTSYLTTAIASRLVGGFELINKEQLTGSNVAISLGVLRTGSGNAQVFNIIAKSNSGNFFADLYLATRTASATTTDLWVFRGQTGNLEAQGSKSITTTSNGSLSLTPNGTGRIMVGSGTPTELLDVNGTARIRSIANATGNFLTTSATGVLQQRTASETRGDIGAQATLISGTNIKTINGSSILGSGDLVLSGGSGAGEGLSIDGSGDIQLGNDGLGVIDISDDAVFLNGFKLNGLNGTVGTSTFTSYSNFFKDYFDMFFYQNNSTDSSDNYSQFSVSQFDISLQSFYSSATVGSTSSNISTNADSSLVTSSLGVTVGGNLSIIRVEQNIGTSTLKMEVLDQINSKGLEDSADYSANKTDNSYITPNWLKFQSGYNSAVPQYFTHDGSGNFEWINI